jgi:hypothetical protein
MFNVMYLYAREYENYPKLLKKKKKIKWTQLVNES